MGKNPRLVRKMPSTSKAVAAVVERIVSDAPLLVSIGVPLQTVVPDPPREYFVQSWVSV